MSENVKSDPVIQDQTVILHQMVKSYMAVVNMAILDMTPKYIILNLIQGTLEFLKMQFEFAIFEHRESQAEKLELLDTGGDNQAKIANLLLMKESISKAMEMLKSVLTTTPNKLH